MNEVDEIAKFHEAVFGKNPGILWQHLKENPATALKSMMEISINPPLQTMETGFILGSLLVYGLREDPLGVKPILDQLNFHMKVSRNVSRKN